MSRIAVSHLAKRFDDSLVVDDVSFEVENGKLAILLGPSGCGKSTILRLIAGLETPTSGTVTIGGRDVTNLPAAERAIAMVFQSYALFPHLSVAENIVFGLKVRGVARAERDLKLKRVADLVGLGALLARKPAQLSGGQRQRVALARAVIAERPVCLMDEPLSNLDAQLRHEMRVEIRELQRRLGVTMVYVTHDQTEAMTMADTVILLRAGKIEQAGPPEQLYDRPATTFAARFIGAPAMNIVLDRDANAPARGVRPEHVRILGLDDVIGGTAVRRAGSVTSVEYLGADSVVSAQLADSEARVSARMAGHVGLTIGEPVAVVWDGASEHRFDRASGARLAH